jgi:ribonucleoside-triphosphate reductase
MKQRTKCEVYSRVVGYLRPVQQWNEGKQSEWKDRKTFLNTNC